MAKGPLHRCVTQINKKSCSRRANRIYKYIHVSGEEDEYNKRTVLHGTHFDANRGASPIDARYTKGSQPFDRSRDLKTVSNSLTKAPDAAREKNVFYSKFCFTSGAELAARS